MRVSLCNDDGDIILTTNWDSVPRVGETVNLNHATSPGYTRTKYEVVRVHWSVSALTNERLIETQMGREGIMETRDIGTHVEVYMRKL